MMEMLIEQRRVLQEQAEQVKKEREEMKKEQAEQLKREREEMMKFYKEKETMRIEEMRNLKEEMRKININNNNINNNDEKKFSFDAADRAQLLSHVNNVLKNTPVSTVKTERKLSYLTQPSPHKHEIERETERLEKEEEKYFAPDHSTYIKNRDEKLDAKEKTIFEDEEEDETHLQSFVKWLERREALHPFNPLSPLYRKRNSLLNPLGRRLEWMRTGFTLGFPIALFGNQNNRWYLYFMQQFGKHGKTTIRKVDVRTVEMPAMSYHNDDTRINVVDADTDDLLPNSKTLGNLPVPLRYSPEKNQTAEKHDLSLVDFGTQYIRTKNLRARLLRPVDNPTSSSSDSSSSDSDDENMKCEVCGVTIKLRPYSKYCVACEELMRKSKRKMKQEKEEKLPVLENVLTYDHTAEVRKAINAQVKTERDDSVTVKSSSSYPPGHDAEEVLSEILDKLFSPGTRLTMKMGRMEGLYSIRDMMSAVHTTINSLGKFSGDVSKAPQWLHDFCMAVYRYRFQTPHCITILHGTLLKEAKAWFEAKLARVSVLPNARVIEAVLLGFKEQYMNVQHLKEFRNQLHGTKMSKIGVTTRELKSHYDAFVTIANNMRLIDRYLDEKEIRRDYLDALPSEVRSFIGISYRNCDTLDEVFQMAEEAIAKNQNSQKIPADGTLRPQTINANMLYVYDDESDEMVPYQELVQFNAIHTPARPNNNRDLNIAWQKNNMSGAVCWHCGGKGHYTGTCLFIEKDQTVLGKVAWAQHNKMRGTDLVYDKQFYVKLNREKQSQQLASTPGLSALSAAAATTPQSSQNRGRGRRSTIPARAKPQSSESSKNEDKGASKGAEPVTVDSDSD